MINMDDLESADIKNVVFHNYDMENMAIITNLGDFSVTLSYGIASCFVILTIKVVLIALANFRDMRNSYEGGDEDMMEVTKGKSDSNLSASD